jgi:uncharacterized protein
MDLDSSFSVTAPIDKVWETLMDFETIASAVPGAQILNQLSEDAYQVGMKVKLGPVTLQYKGQLEVVERDAVNHKAVFRGRGQETRGQGTAEGTGSLSLTEADGVTTGTVHGELSLSGKAAAMGKSVIASVTEQMMGLFAENLQTVLQTPPASPGEDVVQPDQPDTTPVQPDTAPEQPETPADTTPTQPAPTVAPPTTATPVRPTTQPAPRSQPDNSLNALSLAKGVIADQLSNPAKLGAALVSVGIVGFLIGRKSSGRS